MLILQVYSINIKDDVRLPCTTQGIKLINSVNFVNIWFLIGGITDICANYFTPPDSYNACAEFCMLKKCFDNIFLPVIVD